MRHLLIAVAFVALTTFASAQTCPYTVTFTPYGVSCSTISSTPPTLTYPGFPSGPVCNETIQTNVPPLPGFTLTDRALFYGATEINQPLANGCPLLTTIDGVITLPALEGIITLEFLLTPDPALIGLTVNLQAINRRRDDATGSLAVETSNALRVQFQ